VLFRRALHITSRSFPWLAIAGDHADNVALLATLQARLAEREADAGTEASVALLLTFTELLASLENP